MPSLRIIVVGSGGREHALAWALAKSPLAGEIFVAPGNAGTVATSGEVQAHISNVDISSDDIPALLSFAQLEHIDLTVVGPEAPLAAGIVDQFQAAGLRVFGPTQAAAQLESSKAFAKAFMLQQGIPTAAYAQFRTYESARDWLITSNHPVVVKADGLAAGKGVIVCDTREEADAALQRVLQMREFGASGDTVVIEERLSGPEVSVLAFSDGKTVLPMPPARDHKRVFDADQGPNTGGMGAYAPVPDVDPSLMQWITQHVLQPTVQGMAARGTPYVGVLYAGLMLTQRGPQTLEFNCRFGDPETQVILPLLDTDLVEVLLACCNGNLSDVAPHISWHDGACASVVLAAPGYPGSYSQGLVIHGLEQATALPNTMVFHAGTALKDDHIVTNGGRVLAVSAVGPNLNDAIRAAYEGVACIRFDGMHYRHDIGKRQH